LQNGYIKSALLISLREVTNRFTVDSLLNNISGYDAAVSAEFNQKLAPYFSVTQFTSGMKPDKGLQAIILKKSETLQNALAIENQQKAIKAQAANDIISAERDAKVIMIAAQAEADKQKLLQVNLSDALLRKMWIEKWDGQLPTYMLGSNSSTLMQIPSK
jgi:regulator of protease activity HflC (stomatin/prohibitin superfamily)